MSPNPIGFGAMDVTKPYKFIGFGAMGGGPPGRGATRDLVWTRPGITARLGPWPA